jgi:hypothetical protein
LFPFEETFQIIHERIKSIGFSFLEEIDTLQTGIIQLRRCVFEFKAVPEHIQHVTLANIPELFHSRSP